MAPCSSRTFGRQTSRWSERVACHLTAGNAQGGGEGVSQSPLKNNAFLIFLGGHDAPVELRRNCRFHASFGVRKPNVRCPPKSRFPRPKMAGSAARDTAAADGRGRALVVDAAAASPLGYSETLSPEAPMVWTESWFTGAVSDSQAVNALRIGVRAPGIDASIVARPGRQARSCPTLLIGLGSPRRSAR
ncbi:hypothetical protein ACVW1C_004256 [Bradyrhizobium sp. USDA 4011]